MSNPGSLPEVLKLPTASRGGWLLVALVGLALMALGGVDIGTHAPDLGSDPKTLSFLALGAGLFLSFFTLAVLGNRETASALVINRQRRVVTIESSDGAAVDLPLGAIAQVACHAAAGSSASQVLALAKKDGGLLELATFRDDEAAKQVTGVLRDALEAAAEPAPDEDPGDKPAQGPAQNPAARLARTPGVTVGQAGDGLQLGWSGRGSFKSLAAVGCFGGMTVISYGFLRAGYASAIIAMAFMALLALLMVAANLYSIGLNLQVTIDGRHLTIERFRFGRSQQRQALPIWSVVAVDYTHQLNTSGAGLTIRTGKGKDHHDEALNEAGAAVAGDGAELLTGAKVGLAILKMVQSGIHIPAGRLSLATKIALDLTIGEELARRTGKLADPL
jgi:hypothetical protein